MISSQRLQMTHRDVPTAWVFEFYCELDVKLTGEKVKIKSLFNEHDTNPSMVIYYDDQRCSFRFKDFSSGKGGDALDLVMYLTGKNYHEASKKIVRDYNNYCDSNGKYRLLQASYQYSTYTVSSFKKRPWNKDDAALWTQFNIGSRLLEQYCVFPLDYYIMDKPGNPQVVIKNAYLYGYFKKDGTLYKVYQPKNPDRKFIKVETWVKHYIQGMEQLEGHSLLVITSSLKDIMSMKSLRLKVDLVAPDSENTMMPGEDISMLSDKYPFIGVLMDNDKAGIEAMMKYRDEYGLTPVLLPMSKDPSDSIRDFGPRKVSNRLVPLLDIVMNQYTIAA